METCATSLNPNKIIVQKYPKYKKEKKKKAPNRGTTKKNPNRTVPMCL